LNPFFGQYGGMYVGEILIPALLQLEKAFVEAKDDPAVTLAEDRILSQILFSGEMAGNQEDLLLRQYLRGDSHRNLAAAGISQYCHYVFAEWHAMEPDIIVLDEPTAMLDPQGRREVVDTVYSLCRDKGMTVVYITHHMDECIDADRLIIMSNGCIMADGKPESVFANEELLRREGLEQPETARLLQDLRAAGLTLKGEPLNVEDCAELIAQSLQSERSRR